MISAVRTAARNALLSWTRLAVRLAWPVVVATAAATLAALLYVAGNFAIDTATTGMFADDLPFQKLSKRLAEAFPQNRDGIVVVIEGPSPGLADDAGDALAAAVREQESLFPEVFDLQGSPFFRRNGLLYLQTGKLYDLADKLIEAQPFIDALWRDPSLRGLFNLMALAAERTAQQPEAAGIGLAPVLNSMAEVAEAQAAGRPQSLAWQELMGGGELRRTHQRIFQAQISPNYSGLRPGSAAIKAIRSLVQERGFTEQNGYRVRLTGQAALNDDELRSVSIGIGTAGLVSLLLIVTLLLMCFRSPRLVIASLATLIAGLIWTAAFAVAGVGTVNLISVAFAVLFIGLGVDFGIHYALAYRENKEAGYGHASSLQMAARGVGGGITLSAIAAAIGFYAFIPTAYVGLAELGLIAGSGMVIALFASFTVLPAFLTVLEPRLRKPVSWEGTAQLDLANWIRRHHRPILAGAAVLALGSLALAPLAHFDFDPINLKDPESESVSTLLELSAADPARAYGVTVLAEDLVAAAAVSAQLSELAGVHSTRTLENFVPADQQEKLGIIDNLKLFLGPTFAAERAPQPELREVVGSFRDLQAALQRLAANGDAPASEAAARLRQAFSGVMGQRANEPAAFRGLESRLLGDLGGRLEGLRQSLEAEPVTLATLPLSLTERWLTSEGEARVEIYPEPGPEPGVPASQESLRHFVEQIQAVAPEATGSPVIILEAGKAVISAFLEAGGIAVAAIVLMLAIVLRRKLDIVIVFLPLVLAAALTVAASVLIGIPFNFANVIVLPLLFGLGVAGSLHLVVRDAKAEGSGLVMGSSTPRAVLFSALTTIASFGSLALSQHPGTSGMGVLLTVAISLTALCTILVLPALLVVAERYRGAP